MQTAVSSSHRIRFRNFELDLRTRELYKDGIRLKMQGQPLGVLEMLIEHPGELVTREELRKALWPADTYVDFDHSLNAAVMKLREVLGDSSNAPQYIETLPKLGYRFIAQVVTKVETESRDGVPNENLAHAQAAGVLNGLQATPPEPRILPRFWFRRPVVIGAVTVVLCAAVINWYLRRPRPLPRITDYVQLTHEGQIKSPIGTDGVRVYFNQWLKNGPKYGQVSIYGGNVSWVPIDLPDPYLQDVSPDGTMLLVSSASNSTVKLWSYYLVGRTLRHLADSTVASASWSADGTRIAYANAYGEVIVMKGDGSHPRTVVAAAGSLADLNTRPVVWSPDGKRIRFYRNGKIWEVAPDGTGLHTLLSDWRQPSWQRSGRWTPDGEFFIFVSCTPALVARDCQLWAVDERRQGAVRAASDPIQLTFGPIMWSNPILSKDGETIFARGNIPRGELVRYEMHSGRFVPFLGGISAEWVTFSPDGKSVVYTSFPEGILWRANSDGSNPIRLSDPPHYPLELRWSPDGSRILFIEFNGQDLSLAYTIAANSGEPQRVMSISSQSMFDPNWSADGKKIAFTPMSYGGPNGSRNVSSDVRVLDLASQQVQILAGSAGLASPRWSPNGRFICALGRDSLQLLDTRTQKWSRLSVGLGYGFPSFSRDSRYIYFLVLGDKGGVYRVPTSGGKEERVVDLTGFRHTGTATFWMGLDYSDQPILLRELGTDEIYALTLDRK